MPRTNPELTSGFDPSHCLEAAASQSIINPDRPDLDRTKARAGNARGDYKRRIEILGLDQIVAAELFARFREWSVGGQGLAVADPHGRRGGRRLQPVAGFEI